MCLFGRNPKEDTIHPLPITRLMLHSDEGVQCHLLTCSARCAVLLSHCIITSHLICLFFCVLFFFNTVESDTVPCLNKGLLGLYVTFALGEG